MGFRQPSKTLDEDSVQYLLHRLRSEVSVG